MNSTAIATPSPRAGLVDLVGLLLTALALLIAYKLTRPPPAVPVTDLPAARCDLEREVCRLDLPGGGRLELRIEGRPVRPSQPFRITAHSDSATIRPLSLSIRGVEIEMASPASPFTADGADGYRSDAVLPVCAVSRMTWELSVQLDAGGERLRWPLFFATESG